MLGFCVYLRTLCTLGAQEMKLIWGKDLVHRMGTPFRFLSSTVPNTQRKIQIPSSYSQITSFVNSDSLTESKIREHECTNIHIQLKIVTGKTGEERILCLVSRLLISEFSVSSKRDCIPSNSSDKGVPQNVRDFPFTI